MITKMLPLHSLEEIRSTYAYMRDADHPRHRHISIGEQMVLGLGNLKEEEFFTLAAEEIELENQNVRKGRALTVLAHHGIARTPPVKVPPAILTKKERALVPVRIHELIEAKLISQAHLHPMGDVDWHFLIFRRWARKPSPRGIFRRAMDTIHGQINEGRLLEQRPLLPTVEDGRLQRLIYKGFSPLACQLALLGCTSVETIAGALAHLGHRLGQAGVDPGHNIAQVIHQQDASCTAYDYNLSRLLDEARKAQEHLGTLDTLELEADTPDVEI